MVKKIILMIVVFALLYTGLVQFQLFQGRQQPDDAVQTDKLEGPSHRVYFFSFTKYSPEGAKELEIEGDSADILSKTVNLMNVVAKAYAQETPVTITSDEGYYDKIGEKVHLQKNVIATTEDGTRLLTEELDIIPSEKVMETDVQAAVKKDNINIDGMGARGESNLKKVKFKKNVTVVVQDPDFATKAPTVITCDGPLIVDYDKNIAHFHDNVVAEDERGILHADKMDVYYSKESRRVAKIVAVGNVVIENPDGNQTFSDNVVYLAEEGKIILGGNAEAVYFGGDGSSLPKEIN